MPGGGEYEHMKRSNGNDLPVQMDHTLEKKKRDLFFWLEIDNSKDLVLTAAELSSDSIVQHKKELCIDGRLILGVDNKYSLRYDCGDYPDGPCYSKSEICRILEEAGLFYKCYSVYPCLEFPQLIYADDCLPNEELVVRFFPKYNHPESVFEIEESLIDDLIPRGLFHEKANAFIFECSLNGHFSDVKHVTLSADRYPERAFATMIRSDGTVRKQALFPEGVSQLKALMANMKALQKHGVPVVPGKLIDDCYVMPYIDAPLATTYLKRVLREDKERFIALYDRFVELILHSSEHVGENEDGILLKRGYVDMVPLNAFYYNDDFLFFDQEFYHEEYPANAVIYRALIIPYCGDPEVERLCPLKEMLERYGLADKHTYWQEHAEAFLKTLRKPEEWTRLQIEHGRNMQVTLRNRRIKQMREEENVFSAIGDRRILVFGTGRFADKFVDMYHNDYSIVAAVDNDPARQGTVWKGLPVLSPESLRDEKNRFVMVCVKNAEPILDQLRSLGVRHMGVYDAHRVYPGRQIDDIPCTGKPYHIGYCAGVYDLFHIGHVNIFRRAKQQCDYLIVGVVTDEGVRNNKHREPFIPYDERIEMVRACRYVDEAVEIPYIYCRTPDMFEKYHFDVQFSGSDYEHDPSWLAMKQYLNERGADLVFFPYTETTSSTKIKNLIDKGLLE